MGWENSGSDWRLFLSLISPTREDRILDVGAGKGTIAGRIVEASKGAEVYAVDPNEKHVATMKRIVPSIRSSMARAESLPFADAYFDKVYATMAFHHFVEPDRALREFARVLRQGGLLVIIEMNPNSSMGRLFRFTGRLMGERMNPLKEDQMLSKLGAIGSFKVIRSARNGSRYFVQCTRL